MRPSASVTKVGIPDSELNVLFEWDDIDSFSLTVDRLNAKVESSHLFSDPKLQPLMEALILRDFCRMIGCRRCHLTRGFPDAELEESDGGTLSLEITEAMIPGRRRGEEYKDSSDKLIFHDAEDMDFVRANWQNWVLSRVNDKIFKNRQERRIPRYDTNSDFDLLVYVNINLLWELDHLDRLHEAVSDAVSSTSLRRNAIWLYRDTQIFQIYPNVTSHPIPAGRDRF